MLGFKDLFLAKVGCSLEKRSQVASECHLQASSHTSPTIDNPEVFLLSDEISMDIQTIDWMNEYLIWIFHHQISIEMEVDNPEVLEMEMDLRFPMISQKTSWAMTNPSTLETLP